MQKKREKRQIQAVYHQYKSIPRIAIIKTVHNFIASFLLEHHKDKSYFLHSGCPIKRGGWSEKTRSWQEVRSLSPEGEWQEGAPTSVLCDPFLPPFSRPSCEFYESIRVIINWMILLLCIWPLPFFFLILYLSFMTTEVGVGWSTASCPGPSFLSLSFGRRSCEKWYSGAIGPSADSVRTLRRREQEP